jgi:hypothetical protein
MKQSTDVRARSLDEGRGYYSDRYEYQRILGHGLAARTFY